MKPDELAKKFHSLYEKLAPKYGYKTRKETQTEWDMLPENNKQLMVDVCNQILQFHLTFKHDELEKLKAEIKDLKSHITKFVPMNTSDEPDVWNELNKEG